MEGRIVNIDRLLVQWAYAELAVMHPDRTIEVAPERPAGTDWLKRRPTLVTLSANGGSVRDVVLQPGSFVAEVYAPTRVAAFDLAADLVGIIGGLAGTWDGVTVYDASLTVPHYLADPQTGYPRFVAVGTVLCRLAGT